MSFGVLQLSALLPCGWREGREMKDKRNEGKTQRQRKGGQKTVDEDQQFDSRQRNKDGMMERKMGKDIKSKRK